MIINSLRDPPLAPKAVAATRLPKWLNASKLHCEIFSLQYFLPRFYSLYMVRKGSSAGILSLSAALATKMETWLYEQIEKEIQ